ncbi:hypothetical protein D0861_03377 [Hortaea werneckii]|uniref:Uncharacterized protein n=1 Tax=Hortaea werneckii TaxID=91943 RepID=A0A3M7FQ55_HORWE|nr:hypothetical protein KC347_g4803 [Hortaea werneckii]RMY90932.1 hypothetical protein D0861_03377 [Hortaea werneckii]
MSRNLSNCDPNSLQPIDLPSGWNDNSTRLCGISWPSETPYTNLSACCSGGPLEVSSGCWQYCPTDLSNSAFLRCAVEHIGNVTNGGSSCNRRLNAAAGMGTAVPELGQWVGLVMLWVVVARTFL